MVMSSCSRFRAARQIKVRARVSYAPGSYERTSVVEGLGFFFSFEVRVVGPQNRVRASSPPPSFIIHGRGSTQALWRMRAAAALLALMDPSRVNDRSMLDAHRERNRSRSTTAGGGGLWASSSATRALCVLFYVPCARAEPARATGPVRPVGGHSQREAATLTALGLRGHGLDREGRCGLLPESFDSRADHHTGQAHGDDDRAGRGVHGAPL